MSGNTKEDRRESIQPGIAGDVGEVVELTSTHANDEYRVRHNRGGLFSFVFELRRRKVCRAATAYCIALWLVCQVVQVVSPSLGLPDWTLELVLVLGLCGFPITLILSWLFEVTPNGLILDGEVVSDGAGHLHEMPRTRFDQVIDCSLLLVALVIGAELAIGSFSPNLNASPIPSEDLYVNPFPVVSESNGAAFSSALQVELQHEMSRLPAVKVFVPADSRKLMTGSSLTGSVTITEKEVQVTALVVRNKTGELAWSEVLRFSIKDSGGSPRSVAKLIVNALESWPAIEMPGGQSGG